MTENEQDKTLAADLGWKYQKGEPIRYGGPPTLKEGWVSPCGTFWSGAESYPKYTKDLNLTRMVVRALSDNEQSVYLEYLSQITTNEPWRVIPGMNLATPQQEVEAILRTKGLYSA